MNVLETEWWSLGVPVEWWAEQEEDTIVIGDRDGVGTIQISTLRREQGEFQAEEVAGIARDNGDASWDWQQATLGDFSGVSCDYLEETDAVREWYLARGPLLLFVTYSCDQENRGLDLSAVEEILETLAPL
jgi:hypothetical protein